MKTNSRNPGRCRSFISLTNHLLAAVLGLLALLSPGLSQAQITPSGDSYTNTADPITNYGAATLLYVNGAKEISYMQFNLASIPTTANISQATLKVYVNSVSNAGSFNVDYVNAAWLESTIDASNAPPLGGNIASGISVTTADKNQYILINVTSAVQAWLSGSETNDGIALVANSTFNATFDSKENTTTSHAPELDIAYAGGAGTITGVTTASGSGLTGGGTTGTLNLSLTQACAKNQSLQWNGTAWACSSAGTGTITGVTAGTDLTGGGSSGAVILNLDTTRVPQLAAANTFTGNQTVNGNLSATGTVSGGSFEIGSNLFGFGSYTNGNAFLGFAGNSTTTGTYNTASGVNALQALTTGFENTAIGYAALQGNSAAGGNTAVGYGTLVTNSGSFNTAAGTNALYANTTGYQNTATGVAALKSNTTGFYNTANGLDALESNTTGTNNTASGYGALSSNTIGSYNTAFGASALQNSNVASAGWQNDAFGYQSLYSNTTGIGNAAFGYLSLSSSTTANYSSAFGAFSLYHNVSSLYPNDAFGYGALYSNTTGAWNAAFGYFALGANATANGNSAFGDRALASNTTGSGNNAFGQSALTANTTGGSNNAFGASAMYENVGGYPNDAFGASALYSNTTGEYNEAFGYQALYSNNGSYNTAVGSGAMYSNITGNGLTCIGYECNAPGSINNSTAIGAHAVVEQSNALVLGGTGDYAVKVGIGTTTPSNILTIGRGTGHPVSDSWETYSSRRWKTNIHPLQNALSKVEQLRGVSYDLMDSGRHEIGVIAEEVGKILPEIVTYESNGMDARGVDYSRLTALLIEAVKQQQNQIALQQKQIRKQRRLMATQQYALSKLSHNVGVLESSLRTAQLSLTTSLASR